MELGVTPLALWGSAHVLMVFTYELASRRRANMVARVPFTFLFKVIFATDLSKISQTTEGSNHLIVLRALPPT